MTAWWWLGLAVAAVGAGLLAVVDRALHAEHRALLRATRQVGAARARLADRPPG